MSKALEVITRGRDSSGRYVRGTRQAFQHFDRVNEKVGDKLVIVQGAFVPGTDASAGTHDKAGCFDIRTWNLSSSERYTALKEARRLMAAAWYRHAGQGFDPHMHWVLIGDSPMASLALSQIDMYRKGYNGLGWYSHKDDFPYRPTSITNYKYLEDTMPDFTEKDRKELFAIRQRMNAIAKSERVRDANERERDAAFKKRLITALGEQADDLTLLINQTKDDATKSQMRKMQARILTALKEDPEVTGIDNPSDETMQEL